MGTTRPKGQSHIIKRPRLTRLLDETDARVILLCAPAGYGKTTLAREWVETTNSRVLWAAASSRSADVAAFAVDLALALTSDTRGGQSARRRIQGLVVGREPIPVIARELAGVAPPNAVLVIDDCHFAVAADESEELLARFVEAVPLRVLLTSRTRPAFLTARKVVYGEAACIEADQLAFTVEEARAVLTADSAHLGDEILGSARGWPAVIGLAARRRVEPSDVTDRDREGLYEFFAADLFRSAPERVQRALLVLAAGGDADIEIARRLLGPSEDELLRDVVDLGLASRDPENGIALHPLIRDFLRVRINELPHPQRRRLVTEVLHKLRDARRWDDCYSTLQLHTDPDVIAAILTEALDDLLQAGRVTTLRHWIALAREHGVRGPSVLLAASEVALREGRYGHARELAEQAAAAWEEGLGAVRAHLVAARAAHLHEDRRSVRENAERAYRLAGDDESRFNALWIAWLHSFEAQLADDEEALFTRLSDTAKTGDAAFRLAAARGMRDFEFGHVDSAVSSLEAAYGLLPHVTDPLARTSLLNQLSGATCTNAQYERAIEVAREQRNEAHEAGIEFAVDHALLGIARGLIGIRQIAAADQHLEELKRRPGATAAYIEVGRTASIAKRRITAGDLKGAALVLEADPPDAAHAAARADLLALRGIVLAAAGDLAAASESFVLAASTSNYVDSIALRTVGAAIVSLQADAPGATEDAVAAIRIALKLGHLDAVVTAARAYPKLVMSCGSRRDVALALRDVLSRSRDFDIARRAGLPIPRELRKGEPLTTREREICELLVSGRSNREIGDALFISVATTKVHVKHIFEKLGVHSRAEVAARFLAARD